MRFFPIAGFAMLIAALALLLISRTAPPQAGEQIVEPLPTLTLIALDGKTPWNQTHLKGQVTLLNFFASWCVPCEMEMPELANFKKQFPAVHLEGVAWNDEPKTLNAWLAKHGNPFRALWIDTNGDATIALGIKGIPETILVDAKGMMRYRITGPLTPALRRDTIDPLIQQLLAEAQHAP